MTVNRQPVSKHVDTHPPVVTKDPLCTHRRTGDFPPQRACHDNALLA